MKERNKYVPDARLYLRPVCYAIGHVRPVDDRGWTAIYCQRCGKSSVGFKLRYLPGIVRNRLALATLALANFIDNPLGNQFPATPRHAPRFRQIDGKLLKSLGTKHSSDAYSYENLKSLVEQDGPDGYGATMTIADLLSEDNIIEITEDNAEEMVDLINGSLEAESNKQERRETMRLAGLDEEDTNV